MEIGGSMMVREEWKRGPKIGAGGFGTVYLATPKDPATTSLPSVMAVKSVKHSSSLITESEVLNSVQGSPYIIGLLGTDSTVEEETQDTYCEYWHLLLEYASLGSLKDLIRSARPTGLPEAEARRYTRCLLEGLKHIHHNGYVHCDFKPDNVLLVPSSENCTPIPKIADFGLAQRVGDSMQGLIDGSIGTPLYMSPESIGAHEYEPPCDIWALGCVVLEMLTAKYPWPLHSRFKDDVEELKNHIACSDDIPEIPEEKISIEAQNFLRKCLVRDPNKRWTTQMLLSHPFVDIIEDENACSLLKNRGCKRGRRVTVASPRGHFDLPPHSVINISSSTEEEGLVHRNQAAGNRRRKLYI